MSKVCTIKTKEIVNGRNLMFDSRNLKTWESDLDLLENGLGMFSYCYHLTAFSAKTPKLSIGRDMFTRVGAKGWTEPTLRTIQMDFDSLTDGYRMFAECGNIELVSNKKLNGCFDFPLLTDAFEMFNGVSRITVREGGSDQSASFGYMLFSSLTDANHMFHEYKDSYATILSNMFPKATDFEGCFGLACFDGGNLAFLGGVGANPIVTLNCSHMFAYATIGNQVNVDISDNVTDLSNVFINANNMFSEVKQDTYGAISCSDRFMSRLQYANYMFTNCKLDDTEYWRGCCYLESANEMFREANFLYDTLADISFYNLTSAYSMFEQSNIVKITNFYTVNACSRMFSNCESLTDIDIAVANLEDASYMFSSCSYLVNASIKYNPMNPNECDFSRMFDGCYKLQSLSIKSWNDTYAEYEGFPYCKNVPNMFSGCYNLSSDDIVSVVGRMRSLEDATGMFSTSSLTTYPFTNNGADGRLNLLKDASYMFSDCKNLIIDFGLISDKFPLLERGAYMFSYSQNASGSWYTSLPNLIRGDGMFQMTSIQYFGGENGEVLELPNVSCTYFMFAGCAELTDCYMDLGSCKEVYGMFNSCNSLQTVKLHNLSTSDISGGQCLNFFNETKLKHASLHNLDTIYGNCDLMFNTRSPLTIELTNDDGYSDYNLIWKCTSAYRMFANAAWQTWSDISTFLPLQISGLFTGSDCCDVLSNVSHMFSGRIIQDQKTASNIAGIANYAMIATTATSERGFLGHILVEDKNNLSWFNTWGNWTTTIEEKEIFNDYMYQTLARTCQGGGLVSMTVYYPKPDPYTPYAIVEGSQYIPDASTWNEAFASSGLIVTSVHDGYAWNDNLS